MTFTKVVNPADIGATQMSKESGNVDTLWESEGADYLIALTNGHGYSKDRVYVQFFIRDYRGAEAAVAACMSCKKDGSAAFVIQEMLAVGDKHELNTKTKVNDYISRFSWYVGYAHTLEWRLKNSNQRWRVVDLSSVQRYKERYEGKI